MLSPRPRRESACAVLRMSQLQARLARRIVREGGIDRLRPTSLSSDCRGRCAASVRRGACVIHCSTPAVAPCLGAVQHRSTPYHPHRNTTSTAAQHGEHAYRCDTHVPSIQEAAPLSATLGTGIGCVQSPRQLAFNTPADGHRTPEHHNNAREAQQWLRPRVGSQLLCASRQHESQLLSVSSHKLLSLHLWNIQVS